MRSRPEIFAISIILLVPFLYVSSIPDACAVPPSRGWWDSKNCSGGDTSMTCCWRENVPGQTLGERYCQTCTIQKDADGSFSVVSCEDPELQYITTPDSQEDNGVLQDPSTGSSSSPKAGGFLENLKNKLALSQSNNSSTSSNNTLAQLQSDVEDEAKENGAEEEQDESEETETGEDE